MLIVGLAFLAAGTINPRTAFAEDSVPVVDAAPVAEDIVPRCFDGMAALAKMKRDGYAIVGLGFVRTGQDLVEIWVMPDGRFLIVSFEGEKSQVCIEAAGVGWQSYIKME